MKLIFFESPHYLQSISNHDSVGLFLKIFDEPLIIWNLKIIDKQKKIDTIQIPEKYSETYLLIKEQFPSIEVTYISDQKPELSKTAQPEAKILDFSNLDTIELSLNSALYQSKETQETIIENCWKQSP